MSEPMFHAPEMRWGDHQLSLDEETARHAVQVLRMKTGDRLVLTNGKGLRAEAEIVSAGKKTCTVGIVGQMQDPLPGNEVIIAISPLKNAARFEWFLEKAAELGIRRVVPLICSRTERQHFRGERWQNILVSAMLQSRQSWVTELTEPVAFDAFIRSAKASSLFVAHCIPGEKEPLPFLGWTGSALVLIGPEGDFTDAEVAQALGSGYRAVSLGDTRLRTETAGITAAVLLTHRSQK
jgi:16S rRNA (uracil1498-N3)-methyltransferase